MKNEVLKCKTCGETYKQELKGDSFKCAHCGSLNFVVKDSNDERILIQAQTALKTYDFAAADEIYRNIFAETEDVKIKAMCLWGRLLATFGVVFVKSFKDKRYIPTFAKYNPKYSSITKSTYYQKLIELDLSDSVRNEYIEKVKNLDEHYVEIDKDLKKTPEYDVFLCTKISLATEQDPTAVGYAVSYGHANSLYEELTNRGIRVFFSDKDCKGVKYDAQIFSALSKSKIMLVVCNSQDYLESAWVQSEWRRWLNFIDVNVKKEDSIFLYLPQYEGEIPSIIEDNHVQNFGSEKMFTMLNQIQSIVDRERVNNTKISKGASRISIEQTKIEKITDQAVMNAVKVRKVGSNKKEPVTEELLKHLNAGKSRLRAGRFDKALEEYELALKIDKNNGDALKGKFLCEHQEKDFTAVKGDVLLAQYDELQMVIENLDSKSALELLQIVSDNFIESYKELTNKEKVSLFSKIASFDFAGREKLVNHFYNDAIETSDDELLEEVRKNKNLKNTKEYISFYKGITDKSPKLKKYAYLKLFDVDPTDKTVLKGLMDITIGELSKCPSLEKCDSKFITNTLSELKEIHTNFFLKYLGYCGHGDEAEKTKFITSFIDGIDKKGLLSIPSILNWTYKNVFLYYSESIDFRDRLFKLITSIKDFKEEDKYKVSLFSAAIDEFLGKDDLTSSRYLIICCCKAICALYQVSEDCYLNNDFELFKTQVKEEVALSADNDKKTKFFTIGRSQYEKYTDSFIDSKEMEDCYGFLLDFEDNINDYLANIYKREETLKQKKLNTIQTLKSYYDLSLYNEYDQKRLLKYVDEAVTKIEKAATGDAVDSIVSKTKSQISTSVLTIEQIAKAKRRKQMDTVKGVFEKFFGVFESIGDFFKYNFYDFVENMHLGLMIAYLVIASVAAGGIILGMFLTRTNPVLWTKVTDITAYVGMGIGVLAIGLDAFMRFFDRNYSYLNRDYNYTSKVSMPLMTIQFLGSFCAIQCFDNARALALSYLGLSLVAFIATAIKSKIFSPSSLLAIIAPFADVIILYLTSQIGGNPSLVLLIVTAALTIYAIVTSCIDSESRISYIFMFILIAAIVNSVYTGQFLNFTYFNPLYWIRFEILGFAIIFFAAKETEFTLPAFIPYALVCLRTFAQIIYTSVFTNPYLVNNNLQILYSFQANNLSIYVFFLYGLIPSIMLFFIYGFKHREWIYRRPYIVFANIFRVLIWIVIATFALRIVMVFRIEDYSSSGDLVIDENLFIPSKLLLRTIGIAISIASGVAYFICARLIRRVNKDRIKIFE